MDSNFDEIIVGKSNGDFASKMEEEYNKIREQEMEEEKKPLEERIRSKNWKTRKNAYQEILDKLRDEKDYVAFIAIYCIILDDGHPSAQESALEIIKYLFENFEIPTQLVQEIFKTIMEKCFTSSRSTIKLKSKEMLSLALEVSNDSKSICEVIREGLESKNPKIQASAITILTYIISLFGSYKIEYRPLTTNIEKIAESATGPVRIEIIEFYKELFKWVKDAIKNYASKLKETMQKDLEKAFDEMKNNPKFAQMVPTKFLKCDKDKLNTQNEKNDEIKSKMQLIQDEATIFKNMEAVELFTSKYNETWSEDILAKERKWSEKKEMLESFINDSNVFKINNSQCSHIVKCFLKLLKDNNINVVNCAILAINNMAKGLRKDFSEAKEFFVPLLDKFKEKREKVVADVFTCFDSLFSYCLSIDDVLEEVRAFIADKSKTNETKERFCVFIEKTILKTFMPVLKKVCKQIAEILFVLSDDASPDVRNSSLKTLGVLKFRVGEMAISKVLNEICDIKKKKVDEASKNVTVDPVYEKEDKKTVQTNMQNPFKQKPLPIVQMKPVINHLSNGHISSDVEMADMTLNNLAPKFNPVHDDIEMKIEININPPKQIVKSSSTNNVRQNQPKKPGVSNSTSNPNLDVDMDAEEESNLSNDDIEAAVKERIGNEIISMFNDSKWENRKNAFTELANYVKDKPEEASKMIEILLKFIKIKLKDYKENNFNIIKEAVSVFLNLVETCSNFQKKHCVIIIKKLCDKTGDNKLKQTIFNLFFKFMEYHGPKYITGILLKHMTNNVKSPGVLKEFAIFLEKVIEDFGLNLLPMKEMVEYGKFLANNANPQLRSAATTLLCELYRNMGAKIKGFLKDVKEATLKVIEGEFEKITVVQASEQVAKRELKGNACLEAQTATGNTLDSLFPKVDISKKINSKLIKELNDGKWQQKKEALESLEKVLHDANMRILPTGLQELISSLKNKLDDGNKNMVRIMIQFITKLVEALGKDCKQFSKVLMQPIMRNLSDKMNLLREDVIKCLEKWSEMIGFESVLAYCPAFLVVDNFELRTDLLKLILKYKSSLVKFDSKELIPGVLNCLLDKMPSIRTLAEELAKEILKLISINNFYVAMKDFKPAIANTIKSIIEKYSSLICQEPINENIFENIPQHHFKQPEVQQRSVSVNVDNNKPQLKEIKNVNNPNKLKSKRDSHSSSVEKDKNSKEKNKKIQILPKTNNYKPIDTSENAENLQTNQTKQSLIINIKLNQKNKRIENEKKLVFPNEYITQDYDTNLKHIMICHFSKNACDNAYSNDVTKFNALFTQINSTMKTDPIFVYEVTDIILKWVMIRNIEMNNNLFFNNIIFEFFKNLINFLHENESSLLTIENKIIIEVLVSKIFTINAATKLKAKQFFSDIVNYKLIKLDLFIELFVGKINSIYDFELKNELMNLMSDLARAAEYKVEDCERIKNLVLLYENAQENLKKATYELIVNIYNSNKELNEEKLKEILRLNRDTERLIQSDIKLEKITQDPNTDYMIKFSKSPILPLLNKNPNESNSKESLNIKLIDTFDQNKINSILNSFYSQSTNEKIKHLLEFSDIFTNKSSEYVIILEKNIDFILKAFRDTLGSIFSLRLTEDSIDLLKYLLNAFYKAALAKDIIEHSSIETVYNTYEEILRAILYENLDSVGEQEEGKKIIKSLNALVLKFMENFNTTYTFVALIKLIQNYSGDNSRICSLSIKCLLKLSNIMTSLINTVEIDKIMLAIFEFLYEFEKTHPDLNTQSQNEDMCLKILRTIIHEIIKIKNDQIWNYYKIAIEANNLPDKYLKRWIQLILRSKNGISMNMPNINFSASLSAGSVILSPIVTESKSYENELKLYVEKLKNENLNHNNVLCEIIAIIKRHGLPIEILKDKINETHYLSIMKIYSGISNENDENSISINKVSNFNLEKENNYNRLNSTQFKTLQDYRNKLHGISERSANKNAFNFQNVRLFLKKNSPSPIKPIDETVNEKKTQYLENFMKNREMLKTRDLGSELRPNSIRVVPESPSQNADSSSGNRLVDKFAEMKRRLHILKSQKL